MKCANRFLSALAILSMVTVAQVPLGEVAKGAAYEQAIYESFDTPLDIGGWTDTNNENYSWAQNAGTLDYVESDGILGREAEDGDRCVRWRYDGVSGTGNTLFFMPQRGSQEAIEAGRTWGADGAVPAGKVTEVSFDFAVDNKGQDSGVGQIEFTLNAAADHHAMEVVIPFRGAGYPDVINRVSTMSQGSGVRDDYPIANYPLTPKAENFWRNLKFVTVYDEMNNGKVMVYLDDVALLTEPMTFTYTGSSKLPENLGTYSNGSIWSLLFRNTTWKDGGEPYDLYIDNLRMSVRDDTKLVQAMEDANSSLADSAAFSPEAKAALEQELQSARGAVDNTAELASQRRVDYLAKRLEEAVEACETGLNYFIPSLYDDFNRHIGFESEWSGATAWGAVDVNALSYHSRKTFDSEADPADKVLELHNINYLFHVPKRDATMASTGRSWGLTDPYADYIPDGETVEYSFDFAVKVNGTKTDVPTSFGYGGGIEITVNALGDSNPIGMVIADNTGALWGVNSMSASVRDEVRLATDLNPNGETTWHRMTFLVQHKEDGTGKACAYLDGEMVGKVFDFTYTQDLGGLPAGLGQWNRDEFYTVMYRNLTDDELYIDNVSTRVINGKKPVLSAMLEEAYPLYKDAQVGNELGQYRQETKDAFRIVIENAYSVLNGQKTDIEGLPVGTEAVMYTQEEIDAAVSALEQALIEFPRSANSQQLTIAKSGNEITATYQKKAFEDQTWNVRIFVCVYDANHHLLAVIQDSGNGAMDFTGVPAEGELKELSAALDIGSISGATYAAAYAWDSLTGMQPLVSAAELTLQ